MLDHETALNKSKMIKLNQHIGIKLEINERKNWGNCQIFQNYMQF